MIITIDGPTASGKSSVARQLAQDINYLYLNTGLLYRALAYCLIRAYQYDDAQLHNPRNEDVTAIIESNMFSYVFDKKGAVVLYQDHDITLQLKTAEMDQASSIISANRTVRAALLVIQRKLADAQNVIVEGRDCGTVVFPHAQYKFFMTADVRIRAQRWRDDQHKKGKEFTLDESIEFIQQRDTRDMTRSISPLIIPPDAHVIDNSYLSVDQTVEKIKSFII